MHGIGPLNDLKNTRRIPLGCGWNANRITDDYGCNDLAIRWHPDLIQDFIIADMSPQPDPAGSQSP